MSHTGAVVHVRRLTKVYRAHGKVRRALDGLDLVVEPGQVHGFLGPNGSGKTTTLRALLGLVRADAGTMRVLGREAPAELPAVIGAVGAVVESPQFFGNFTVRRTLRLLATTGGVKRKRVDEVLEMVGLRDRARERVRTCSLGMRQRLAVAAALLKSPKLLILDEPANGLDPAGIRQTRDLLGALAASGMTVLLSSHILSEVQQICDTVSIISRGRRVVSGSVADVLSQFDKGDVRVTVSDLDTAAQVIREAGLPVTVDGDHMIVSDLADPAWITETLARRRLYVSELTPLTPDLENVFLNLTGTAPTPGERSQVDDAYRPPAPDGPVLFDHLHAPAPDTRRLAPDHVPAGTSPALPPAALHAIDEPLNFVPLAPAPAPEPDPAVETPAEVYARPQAERIPDVESESPAEPDSKTEPASWAESSPWATGPAGSAAGHGPAQEDGVASVDEGVSR